MQKIIRRKKHPMCYTSTWHNWHILHPVISITVGPFGPKLLDTGSAAAPKFAEARLLGNQFLLITEEGDVLFFYSNLSQTLTCICEGAFQN